MKLRELFALYLKSRALSWLTTSTQIAYINADTTYGQLRIQIAEFRNGRMMTDLPQAFVPDTVPAEWNTPSPPPPPPESTE